MKWVIGLRNQPTIPSAYCPYCSQNTDGLSIQNSCKLYVCLTYVHILFINLCLDSNGNVLYQYIHKLYLEDEVFDFDNLVGFDWDAGNKLKNWEKHKLAVKMKNESSGQLMTQVSILIGAMRREILPLCVLSLLPELFLSVYLNL